MPVYACLFVVRSLAAPVSPACDYTIVAQRLHGVCLIAIVNDVGRNHCRHWQGVSCDIVVHLCPCCLVFVVDQLRDFVVRQISVLLSILFVLLDHLCQVAIAVLVQLRLLLLAQGEAWMSVKHPAHALHKANLASA